MMKKWLAILLAVCLISSLSTSAFALESQLQINDKNNDGEVAVIFVDPNGNRSISDLPPEHFLSIMNSPKESQTGINPFVVPTPDESSIRITDVVSRVVNVEAQIEGLVKTISTLVWARYGGSIINAITGKALASATWIGVIRDTSIAHALSSGLASYIDVEPLYTDAYAYKSWSEYYQVYIIYNVYVVYTDSTKSHVQLMEHHEVGTSIYPTGLR